MNFLNDSCNISFVRDPAKIQRKTKGKRIFISSILSFLSTDWPTTRTTPDKHKKRERMTVSRDKFNNKKFSFIFARTTLVRVYNIICSKKNVKKVLGNNNKNNNYY